MHNVHCKKTLELVELVEHAAFCSTSCTRMLLQAFMMWKKVFPLQYSEINKTQTHLILMPKPFLDKQGIFFVFFFKLPYFH